MVISFVNFFLFFYRHALDGRFVAHIVSRKPHLSVILYESSSGREININERILEQVAENIESKPLKVR